MTTNEKLTLGWGCKRGLPEGVTAAYGERKIAPFDRGRADWQGSDEKLNELEAWLNAGRTLEQARDVKAPIMAAREKAIELRLGLGDGTFGARCEDVVTLFEDDRGKIVGSPQGSHGYVYIAAWLFAHVEHDADAVLADPELMAKVEREGGTVNAGPVKVHVVSDAEMEELKRRNA